MIEVQLRFATSLLHNKAEFLHRNTADFFVLITSGRPGPRFFETTKKRTFSTISQLGFASDLLDRVLGPPRLARNT